MHYLASIPELQISSLLIYPCRVKTLGGRWCSREHKRHRVTVWHLLFKWSYPQPKCKLFELPSWRKLGGIIMHSFTWAARCYGSDSFTISDACMGTPPGKFDWIEFPRSQRWLPSEGCSLPIRWVRAKYVDANDLITCNGDPGVATSCCARKIHTPGERRMYRHTRSFTLNIDYCPPRQFASVSGKPLCGIKKSKSSKQSERTSRASPVAQGRLLFLSVLQLALSLAQPSDLL